MANKEHNKRSTRKASRRKAPSMSLQAEATPESLLLKPLGRGKRRIHSSVTLTLASLAAWVPTLQANAPRCGLQALRLVLCLAVIATIISFGLANGTS